MTAIENYIDDKRKNSNPFGFLEDFRYKNTKDIASPNDEAAVTEPTIIQPPYWNSLLMFSPFVVLGGVVTYLKLPTHDWLLPLCITVIVAVVLIIITIRNKQNPEITLTADKQKLVIKSSTYLWSDILNTYIMTKYGAKSNNKWLLLENPDGVISEVSIDFIGISNRKLSAIMEYYKKNNTNNL